MSHPGRRTPEYKAAKEAFATGRYLCHICGVNAGTTPDHDPPLHTYPHWALWHGRFLPACVPCQNKQGGLIRDEQRMAARASRQW